MMRALIVDDEMYARDELASLLGETGAFTLVGVCADAVSALKAIRSERPDVVFLDIQMPAISGFQLLSMIDDADMPQVVFVTAHDEHALRAFEENAVDYLLKPVSRARLEKTVERLRHDALDPGVPTQLRMAILRVPCLAGRAVKLVDASEIEFARSSEAGVYVVSAKGEFFTELTLRVLEDRAGLVRCHKQYLVRVDRIAEVQFGEGGATLRTRSGRDVPVSRRLLPAIRERLGI
ncbi:MAG: two-component system response regulator BtsR [Deltaproteobacteria bacterium]|nr:two-component system response regulator BtsR [Deltaproteobacteria bacterium]